MLLLFPPPPTLPLADDPPLVTLKPPCSILPDSGLLGLSIVRLLHSSQNTALFLLPLSFLLLYVILALLFMAVLALLFFLRGMLLVVTFTPASDPSPVAEA